LFSEIANLVRVRIGIGAAAKGRDLRPFGEGERAMTGEVLSDMGEGAPGRGQLKGTDLEVGYNLQGDNLVLRVNKGGVLVFRAMLRDAVPPMLESRLMRFNSFAPDFVFTIGDTEEGLRRMLLTAGIMDDTPPPRRCWPG
jgi:hypothetical protein